MFAVIRTGGKQYKVAKDDVISVERLTAEAGQAVQLSEVLAVGDGKSHTLGAPLITDAMVTATVLEQKRDDKIIVFKKKRRHNYRRRRGHRQYLTVLRITDILTDGKKPTAKPAAAKAKPAEKAEEKPKTEAKKAEDTKTEAKKTETKKPAAKKTAAKKPAAKKPAAKKPAAKKPAAKK